MFDKFMGLGLFGFWLSFILTQQWEYNWILRTMLGSFVGYCSCTVFIGNFWKIKYLNLIDSTIKFFEAQERSYEKYNRELDKVLYKIREREEHEKKEETNDE